MEQIKCPGCGASLKGEVDFCEYCGATFHKKEAEVKKETQKVTSFEEVKEKLEESKEVLPDMMDTLKIFTKTARTGVSIVVPIIAIIIFLLAFFFIVSNMMRGFSGF